MYLHGEKGPGLARYLKNMRDFLAEITMCELLPLRIKAFGTMQSLNVDFPGGSLEVRTRFFGDIYMVLGYDHAAANAMPMSASSTRHRQQTVRLSPCVMSSEVQLLW